VGRNAVARYYDASTWRFLLAGPGRDTRTIHRELWGPGVTSRAESVEYVHGLIAHEIERASVGEEFRLLDLEKRLSLKTKPSGYLGSIIIGITFAAAWTPCAGPIIGSILVLAGTQETLSSGVMLLIAYSFGLAIPFFVTSLAFNSALIYFKRINKYLGIIEKVSGFLLIVVGGLLLTNYFESIITYLALKGGLLWQSK